MKLESIINCAKVLLICVQPRKSALRLQSPSTLTAIRSRAGIYETVKKKKITKSLLALLFLVYRQSIVATKDLETEVVCLIFCESLRRRGAQHSLPESSQKSARCEC